MEAMLKNAARGLLVGLLAGPVITLYANLVSWANEFNSEFHLIILLLPIGAVLIAYSYKKLGSESKGATRLAIDEIHYAEDGNFSFKGLERITAKMGAITFFNTILSHFLGASVGKEGGGVQIALSCASVIDHAEEKLLGESRRDYYLMSGASAAFSALFGAPVAGTLFGSQIASPRLSRFDALLPTLISSFTAYFVSQSLHIHIFTIPSFTPLELNLENTIIVFLLAIVIGLFSRASCYLLEFFKTKLSSIGKTSIYVKVVIPASIIAALSFIIYFLTGSFIYNGLSTSLISYSMAGDVNILDFIIKLLMVLLSLAAGFQGGEVVPLLVLGATLSSTIASIFKLDPASLSILGAVGFLSAGMKLPLVTFALALEMFNYSEPALLFLMTALALITSGKNGIYSHQRIY